MPAKPSATTVNAKPSQEATDAGAPAAPAGRKGGKLVVMAAALLLAAGAAGGAWAWMHRDAHPAPPPPRTPLFSALEPFTVNLQEPRGDRFAQIGITLQYEDPEMEVRIKDRLPAVRNNVLMLLSAKHVDELITPEGKLQLANEIQVRSAMALGFEPPAAAASAPAHPNPIRAVLFSQFIVQ